MLTHCPYCQSTHIHRVFVSHSKPSESSPHRVSLLSSHVGFGGMVIKQLFKGWPLSPWITRLAEALLKSVYLYWIETRQSHFDSGIAIAFYCEQCQQYFKL
jgi:hypothetical protein